MIDVGEAGDCLAQDDELKVPIKRRKERMNHNIIRALGISLLILTASTLASIPMVSAAHGPRTEDLIINFYSSVESAYAALKAGSIDLLAHTGWSIGLPLHDGKQFSADLYYDAISDPNIVLAPLAGMDVVGYDFNNNHTIPSYPGVRSPMTYLSFRQALAFLVDKDFIVDAIKGGLAQRIDVPIPLP
ncbi:MAG: hypothetical protein JSV64_02475, partial [Candidatus Bathyarchaeota archaeon]